MLRAIALLALATAVAGCQRTAAAPETIDAASPAGPGSSTPHLAAADDGSLVMSWVERDGDTAALRFARRVGEVWSPAHTVASGADWFLNWADFPSVSPIHGDFWVAHWLVKRPGGTYAYDIAVAVSSDGGVDWRAPATPHNDGTPTEHGFVSLFPVGDGAGALWLDGRDMTAAHGDHAPGASAASGGMTLRSARIDADGKVADGRLVDDLVCDCCQTDVAIAAGGPVAAYRNRTDDEIRDIHTARWVRGGWQLGGAVADDGWQIAGCPVNGPAVAADGGDVAVAWFTGAGGQPRIRLARSDDGGARFGAPVDVAADRPAGRVDVAMLDGGAVAVSFLDRTPDGAGALIVQTFAADGHPGARHVVARMATSRSAGFPQMLRQGGQLVFAWTEVSGDGSRVRTASRAIADLL